MANDISLELDNVARAFGYANAMTRNSYINTDVRKQLEVLAVNCGATNRAATGCDTGELITLYLVALKRADSGREIAAKLNRKYDASATILDPAPSSAIYNGPDFAYIDRKVSDLAKDIGDDVSDLQRQLYSHKELAKSLSDSIDTLADQAARSVDVQKAEIAELVGEALKLMTPTNLTVTGPSSATPVPLGLVHQETAYILRTLSAGLNVYLHGPAGSGKTTMAVQIAKALGLAFHFAAKIESEYLLLGFRDARGETIRTPFREAYEHGGLFLFDELDRSSPGAVVAINAALANEICAFPDGVVKMHKDFRCIAAGNTVMTGASRTYTAGVQQDASSVDRFYFIEFGYDETLEMAIASNKDWCGHVQAIRKVVADRGLNHLVTPRATISGCKSLEAGNTWAQTEYGTIFKGLDASTVEQIKAALPDALVSATPRRNGTRG